MISAYANLDKKSLVVETNVERKALAWLGLPVSDSPFGICYVKDWRGWLWAFCTDGYRMHALRLHEYNQPESHFPITRLIWELKFNAEDAVEVQYDPESYELDRETGERSARLAFIFWQHVQRAILESLRLDSPKALTKGHASLVLEFYINSTPGAKRALERKILDQLSGQGRLL